MAIYKTILQFLISFYLFGLCYIFLKSHTPKLTSQNDHSFLAQNEDYNPLDSIDLDDIDIPTEPPYMFKYPELANQILAQLDLLNVNDYRHNFKMQPTRFNTYINLKNHKLYCAKHRAYFVQFPSFIFDEINAIFDIPRHILIRHNAIPPIGNDIQPDIGAYEEDKNITMVELQLNANIFLSRREMYTTHQIGQHFSCITQTSNHIPGDRTLAKKNNMANAIIKYAKEYDNKPQCFSYDRYFPRTWLLYEKESCQDFFAALNSEEYQTLKNERRIVYIRKVGEGAHMGSGVQPVNDEEENTLRKDYNNGELCGTIDKNYIIQQYIHNPLLLNGHKFDFRLYLLVASSNPLMVYYHDGFLRVSLSQYDINSDDKKVLLTNLALSETVYQDARKGILYEGMDAEGLKHAQQWSFDRLQSYLLESGVINDPNWLDNHLRPELKKAFTHLMRLAKPTFIENSSLFQLYGVDFMLDTDMKVWFIEANSAPGLGGYSQEMEKIIVKMLQDHIEIAVGLLRSRVKRMIVYVNKLVASGLVTRDEEGEPVIYDLEKRRKEFQNATKNYFEKEFEPKPDNGFAKIIDNNLEGVERYQGYIDEECL